jgi:D-alanyl-lipoteichoic acid acyltransferase DltB (MBOAT superfamily)
MGFHLLVNFRQPFLACGLRDFWRRWHISLSTWLRDYLYIPLGGSTQGPAKTSRNLFVTLVLAGLWHGANWTFVIFGAIHGIVLVVERFLFPGGSKSGKGPQPQHSTTFSVSVWAQRILTFNILGLSLAFFRASSLSAAVRFLAGLPNFSWRPEYFSAFLILCIFSVPLFVADLLLEASGKEYPFATAPYAVRTGVAALALVVLALFSGSNLNAFIYFQF